MSIAVESFQVLAGEHGLSVSVTSPTGLVTPIDGVWSEQPNNRHYDEKGDRTIRMGVLLVLDDPLPEYQQGEFWTIRSEAWQVQNSPNFEDGIRIYQLRRDDKNISTQSRTTIL